MPKRYNKTMMWLDRHILGVCISILIIQTALAILLLYNKGAFK